MVRPGELDERITHVSVTESTNSDGTISESTTETDMWAMVKPTRERTQMEGKQFAAEVRTHFFYRSDVASMQPDDRIKYDGETYRVLSVVDREQEGRFSRAVAEVRRP